MRRLKELFGDISMQNLVFKLLFIKCLKIAID